MTTCQESVQLGAYLLGALDPEERSALEAHIEGCEQCRAELLAMAPLPGLLRHTAFEELEETAAAAESLPPAHRAAAGPRPFGAPGHEARPEAGPEPVAEPVPERGPVTVPGPRHGRPRRRLLVSAGLGLAAVAAVAGAWVYAGGVRNSTTAPPAAAATLSAQDPHTHVTAAAALTPETWGTQLQLKLGNLPAGITCRLVVHGRDGRTETAGTWGSGYSATAVIPASTSIGPSDIAGLDVVDGSGNVLVSMSG